MCLGDIHGNINYGIAAIEHAYVNGCDTIMQVGDFGYWREDSDMDEFIDTLNGLLEVVDIVLYWIDGNHEDHSRLYPHNEPGSEPWFVRSRIIHLPRGFRWQWFGKAWMALGGAYSVDRHMRKLNWSWWAGETLTQEQILYACRPGDVDVIIAHDAPVKVNIPGISQGQNNGFPWMAIYQSEDHRTKVQQVVDATKPGLFVHGHYHRRYQDIVDNMVIVGLDCDGSPLEKSTLFLDRSTFGEET